MAKKETIIGFLYLLPVIAIILFLTLYPIGYAVYISFTNFNLYHFFHYSWVGLANYITIIKSGTLGNIFLQTIIWTVGSLIPMMAAGFLLALVLNQRDLWGKNIYMTLMLFPWAFPSFITILVWSGMWNYKYGIVNKFLGLIGIKPIFWFNYVPTSWAALIFTNLWLSFPYFTVVFTSALQGIPRELYETAYVDGASMFRRFTSITLPQMKNALSFVGISSFIFTWNNFYPIYLLTGGGPGTATEIFVVYAYQEAFSYNLFNIAAAYSIVDTIILAAFALLMLRLSGIMKVIT